MLIKLHVTNMIIPRDADKREGDFLKVFPPKTSFLKEIRLFSSSPKIFARKITFISLNESSVAHRGAVFEKNTFFCLKNSIFVGKIGFVWENVDFCGKLMIF